MKSALFDLIYVAVQFVQFDVVTQITSQQVLVIHLRYSTGGSHAEPSRSSDSPKVTEEGQADDEIVTQLWISA